MVPTLCLEDDCAAPAAEIGECEWFGVDFDGRDAFFHAYIVRCLDGHQYHVVEEDGVVKL